MRSLRYSVAVFGLMAVAAPWSMAADYGPKDLLKFRPTQTGVDYDTPTDAAAIEACKVELVTDAQKRTVGYALRDGQGKLLRRFVITNGGKYLNQWSYYQDGFEVYRENDLDGDRTLDECRWLNGGGTRVAVIKSGKIACWNHSWPLPRSLRRQACPRMWSTRSPPGRPNAARRSRPFRSHSPAGPPRP